MSNVMGPPREPSETGRAGRGGAAERASFRAFTEKSDVELATTITMGSLFDGIGGFPLAAARYGIKTIWASEIEPFPMAVTMRRFPSMVHKGDIMLSFT